MRRIVRSVLILSLMLVPLARPSLGATGEGPFHLKLEPFVFEAEDGKVEAKRGTITVPESRSRPDGRTIDLAFVRFRSTSRKPGSPIVYLAGGPGGSGIGAATGSRFPLFQALREVADVIAFDQRGTGQSQPEMQCEQSRNLPLNAAGSPEAMLAEVRAQSRACAASMRAKGIDLAAYNSVESADDLDALRRALGAEKISLWAISYGTHLAFATLRRHGPHIDRVILAGTEGPDQSWKLPSAQQALLAEIGALVKRDPVVGKAVPNLLGLMAGVLDRLGRQPVTVVLTHPETGQSLPVTVGKFDLQVATAAILTGPDSFAPLPDLYARMAAGDFVGLALQVAQESRAQLGSAMSYAMDCASGATAARLRRIAEEAPGTLLGGAINFPFPGICTAWEVPDLGDAFRAPLVTDVPALFISGTLDGRTPVANAEEVRRGFRNSLHLVIEGAGHSDPLFLSSPHIAKAMLAFLEGKPVRKLRIELPPPSFLPPRQVAAVGSDVLAKYVGVYRIDDKAVRRVSLVGDLLYTQRTGRPMLPIRPQSETEFFYEGMPTHLKFVVGADGRVSHMVMFQDGREETAPKVE